MVWNSDDAAFEKAATCHDEIPAMVPCAQNTPIATSADSWHASPPRSGAHTESIPCRIFLSFLAVCAHEALQLPQHANDEELILCLGGLF